MDRNSNNFSCEPQTVVLRGNSTAAGNSTLAIGGVQSPLASFVVTESSVLRTNFCAKIPAHRQSAKRYQKPVDDKKQRTEQTLNIPNPSRPTAHFSTFPFFQPRQATALKM